MILLSLRGGNSYGYELMKQLTKFGFEAVSPGTMYRTLRRLERSGFCESRWEPSKGRPARRRYTITEAGDAYLRLWIEALEQYQRMTNSFLRVYTGRRP